MKDLERKLETLSAACKSLDLSLIDLKSKDESLESELKNMKVQVENLPEISSSLDQLKSVESKVMINFVVVYISKSLSQNFCGVYIRIKIDLHLMQNYG